jgi:prepilin-type N-terminal cleavage/methylation domain-containing protein
LAHATIIESARPPRERRAFSLLELMATVTIVGLIAGLAVMRFGHDGIETIDAAGFVRKLTVTTQLARRQAICEGFPAAIVFTRSGTKVSSWQLVRVTAGGDQAVDDPMPVPTSFDLSIPTARWQFDYTGQLTSPAGGASADVTSDFWEWSISISPLTGHVSVQKYYDP